jgi:hypothetical protein
MDPARSAALYAQYWQQKATIFGSKSSDPKFYFLPHPVSCFVSIAAEYHPPATL